MKPKEAYYYGWFDCMCYLQADQDVKENDGQPPIVKVRMPKEIWNGTSWEPWDYDTFKRVVNEYNDGGIIYLKFVFGGDRNDDHVIVASTEGYQGLPEDHTGFECYFPEVEPNFE